MGGRTSLVFIKAWKGMSENVFINTKNKSHTITAEVEMRQRQCARRSVGPGRTLWRLEPLFKDGKPTYTYNWLGLKEYPSCFNSSATSQATIDLSLPMMADRVRGGKATVFVSGQQVATGRIDQTQANAIFSG